MMDVDTSRWTLVGETANSRYFELEPGILAAVPHPGSKDDRATASENQRFQNEHWCSRGRGGVVLVFFDRMVSQDKDARRVYQYEPDVRYMRATLLIGGTLLSRAMGSFFLGLTRSRIPVKMFGTLDEALAQARQINAEADAATAAGGAR